jgi:hypothetical protein
LRDRGDRRCVARLARLHTCRRLLAEAQQHATGLAGIGRERQVLLVGTAPQLIAAEDDLLLLVVVDHDHLEQHDVAADGLVGERDLELSLAGHAQLLLVPDVGRLDDDVQALAQLERSDRLCRTRVNEHVGAGGLRRAGHAGSEHERRVRLRRLRERCQAGHVQQRRRVRIVVVGVVGDCDHVDRRLGQLRSCQPATCTDPACAAASPVLVTLRLSSSLGGPAAVARVDEFEELRVARRNERVAVIELAADLLVMAVLAAVRALAVRLGRAVRHRRNRLWRVDVALLIETTFELEQPVGECLDGVGLVQLDVVQGCPLLRRAFERLAQHRQGVDEVELTSQLAEQVCLGPVSRGVHKSAIAVERPHHLVQLHQTQRALRVRHHRLLEQGSEADEIVDRHQHGFVCERCREQGRLDAVDDRHRVLIQVNLLKLQVGRVGLALRDCAQ